VSPRLPVALGAAAVAVASAVPAWSYVRTTSNDGHPLHWGRRDPQATLYVASAPANLPPATLVHAVHAAAAAWSSGSVPCTDMQIQIDESNDGTAEVAAEGVSRIVFRQQDWAYGSDVLALTSVYSRGAVIFDADMELNGVTKTWADVVADGVRDHYDVQNAVTHELGHFLGFDHTCWEGDPSGPRPSDNHGQPIPLCKDASPEIQATTMFPSADVGDTSKRDLSMDDVQAVCDVYPKDSGCSFGG